MKTYGKPPWTCKDVGLKPGIIQTEWRSGFGTVGIVLTCREDGTFKAYIGPASDWKDEKHDAKRIAEYGAPLTFEEAQGFFPWLEKHEYAAKSK